MPGVCTGFMALYPRFMPALNRGRAAPQQIGECQAEGAEAAGDEPFASRRPLAKADGGAGE